MAWNSHGRCQSTLVDALVSNGLLRSPQLIQAFKATDRAHFIPTTTTPTMAVNPYQDCPQSIGYNVTISAPHMHAMMAELIYSTIAPLMSKTATTATPPIPHHLRHQHEDENTRRDDADDGGISILDVGSGSGYLTAIMAHMLQQSTPSDTSSSPSSTSPSPQTPTPTVRGRVYGVEHVPELVAFSKGGIQRGTPTYISSAISIVCGDGRQEATYQNERGCLGGGAKLPLYFDAIHVGAASHRSAPHALVSRLKLGGSLVIPIDEELHVITRKLDGCGCTDRVESGVRFVPLTSLKRQLGDDDE